MRDSCRRDTWAPSAAAAHRRCVHPSRLCELDLHWQLLHRVRHHQQRQHRRALNRNPPWRHLGYVAEIFVYRVVAALIIRAHRIAA